LKGSGLFNQIKIDYLILKCLCDVAEVLFPSKMFGAAFQTKPHLRFHAIIVEKRGLSGQSTLAVR
jgi:hypothetical protein